MCSHSIDAPTRLAILFSFLNFIILLWFLAFGLYPNPSRSYFIITATILSDPCNNFSSSNPTLAPLPTVFLTPHLVTFDKRGIGTLLPIPIKMALTTSRSEERRVGKEC